MVCQENKARWCSLNVKCRTGSHGGTRGLQLVALSGEVAETFQRQDLARESRSLGQAGQLSKHHLLFILCLLTMDAMGQQGCSAYCLLSGRLCALYSLKLQTKWTHSPFGYFCQGVLSQWEKKIKTPTIFKKKWHKMRISRMDISIQQTHLW